MGRTSVTRISMQTAALKGVNNPELLSISVSDLKSIASELHKSRNDDEPSWDEDLSEPVCSDEESAADSLNDSGPATPPGSPSQSPRYDNHVDEHSFYGNPFASSSPPQSPTAQKKKSRSPHRKGSRIKGSRHSQPTSPPADFENLTDAYALPAEVRSSIAETSSSAYDAPDLSGSGAPASSRYEDLGHSNDESGEFSDSGSDSNDDWDVGSAVLPPAVGSVAAPETQLQFESWNQRFLS